MARRAQEFQTIRSEGGLLPSDLLRRVIDPRGSLKGTRPEDYGLPQGERLNEVITQSWNRLRRHWGEFRATAAKLPEGEAGTGLTNDKWSLPLLRELGFGLLPTSASPEIAGRTYAISRFFGSVPIHLVGCGLSLDRRAAGVRGAAGGNPHGLVQEVLNRSPDHLWGIVGNGLRLRILRDNQALSRQSFLEFDLEAMFAAEAYSDFVLLWLVAHATRFAPRDGNRIESCWLEEWTKEAQEQGTRALKDLRGSVERALQVLGEGFTSHPKNTTLREALRTGTLPLADFHGQLLRVVYRLIFLFVAEDRTLEGQPLLHPRDDSESARVARERYAAHYGTARLRDLAGKIKGSRHGDLWRQFQILVGALSGEPAFEGTRRTLALPALGSFLWSPGSTADLSGAELTNHEFLEALRHLAFTRQGKVLRPVDYRNLGAEELGGVYESLLALTPQISADGARFTFAEFAGNERKTSGSYYTPDSLVQCLLDSALDPVVEEAIKGKAGAEAEQAILGLKVCDPAVGSGHFLVGAAHRLARHLARVRAQAQGESEPSPLLYQHALRDVIGRCLYGVDLNPMAAELCRVSLWLEALEPGKPLSFLDHHIRVGNSLLGTTPELIAGGLPDEAFNPIEGDDKKACTELKKRNRAEGKGLGSLFVAEDTERAEALRSAAKAVDEMDDDTPERLARKAQTFAEAQTRYDYVAAKRLADAWCAAFIIHKHFPPLAHNPKLADIKPYGISQRHLGDLAQGRDLPPELAAEVDRLAQQYQFFHWHLAFPEVFGRGGFDCILGNPPWERVKLQEQEFFATSRPDIVEAPNKEARAALIQGLAHEDPTLLRRWQHAQRFSTSVGQFLKNCGWYPLCGGGDVNTSSVFAELGYRLIAATGRMGVVVPTSVLTDDTTKLFTQEVVQSARLSSVYDFDNSERLFPAVRPHQHFILMTVAGRSVLQDCDFAFFLTNPQQLDDSDTRVALSAADIAMLNPNTRTMPVFRSSAEAKVTKAIYRAHPLLKNDSKGESGDPWGLRFLTMFHMAADSEAGFLLSEDQMRDLVPDGTNETYRRAGYVPLFDAKMAAQYQHRAASVGMSGHTFRKISKESSTVEDLLDPSYEVTAAYWVSANEVNARLGNWERDWLLGFKDVTGITSTRLSAFAFIPRQGVGHPFPLVFLDQAKPSAYAAFAGYMNSLLVEYLLRQKMQGLHLTYFLVKQLPAPTPATLEAPCPWDLSASIGAWLAWRVAELSCTSWALEGLARDLGVIAGAYRWDEERRLILRAEIDAAIFQLFQLSEDDVRFVIRALEKVARKDETVWGRPRTEEETLRAFCALTEATRTRLSYVSPLDPPPGPPRDAQDDFLTPEQLAEDPPPHMHLPRGRIAGSSVALHLSDLASRFPTAPFQVRLGSSGNARALRIRPVRTEDVQTSDLVVLASPNLRSAGNHTRVAVGKLRAEARTDASDGSTYVLVTVRGEDGTAQARFSEGEWRSLTTIGVVEDSAGS